MFCGYTTVLGSSITSQTSNYLILKLLLRIPKFQNSVTLEEFEQYLINIYTIFHLKKVDSSLMEALNLIRTNLITRDLNNNHNIQHILYQVF